jgi:hypothetical protein
MWISRGKSNDLAAEAGIMSEMIWRAIANPDLDDSRQRPLPQLATSTMQAMR